MRGSVVALFSMVALASAGADRPYLVRDLPGFTVEHSDVSPWATIGNTTWFAANVDREKREIFRTDGTPAGTAQVTNGSAIPDNFPAFLGVAGEKIVYRGVDAEGEGAFALDTQSGELVRLSRIQPLARGVTRGDAVYFAASQGGERELWRTDGTPAGTAKIDLVPGSEGGAFDLSRDRLLYALREWMFFYGASPQGTGLHRTDGTPANTTLLLPLTPSALDNDRHVVYGLGARLLFELDRALWVTDGTQLGTLQIATLSSRFEPLGSVGETLLFNNGGVMWTTDGTAANTRRTDVYDGTVIKVSHAGHVVGNRLFFYARASGALPWIQTLYVTEGTAATTRAILNVDLDNGYGSGEGFVIGDHYYFRHDDGIHGSELWRTDGTTAALFADLNPRWRRGIDFLRGIPRPDGTVMFTAFDPDAGEEPWITDGTPSGTRLLFNCAPEVARSGSSPLGIRANGARVFFTAELTGGQAIGTSDGTSAGTSAILMDFPWAIHAAAVARGRYFFSVWSTNAQRTVSPWGLYVTDGTAAGTTGLSEIAADPHAITGGVLFLDSGDLWFSDGTPGGTRKVRAFGHSSPGPRIFTDGDTAWIAKGPRLWRTDGTDAGTVEITPATPPTEEIYLLRRAGAHVYFIESSNYDRGARLWRSDGTAGGTAVVKEFAIAAAFVGATEQYVYFTTYEEKLYRTDGTVAGTIELPVSSPCLSGAIVGNVFLLSSINNGTIRLWRTDGTVAGTTEFASIKPPVAEFCPSFVVRGGVAYFRGWDAAHGWELWSTDGTPVGTKLVADIYPGPNGSWPEELTLAGDRVFFSAEAPEIGRELWAVGGQRLVHRRGVRR